MGLTVMLADFQQYHTLSDLRICQLTPSLAQALSGQGSYRDTSLLQKKGMVNHQIQVCLPFNCGNKTQQQWAQAATPGQPVNVSHPQTSAYARKYFFLETELSV